MSDHEFDLELEGDSDSLYCKGGEPEEEVRPVPSLPSLPSLPLERGEDGPLFPEILLVEVSEEEPLSDPSSLLDPGCAGGPVSPPWPPVPMNRATERGIPEVAFLESSDSEIEEQQDQVDLQDLPSSGSIDSQETILIEGGVERIPELRSEPSGPVVDAEAQRKASLQATLDCLSGKGSGPQPPDARKLGTVGSSLLQD